MADETPFALTPSAAIQGIIDFRTAEGRKLYERATARLSDTPFDCTAENLFRFIEEVSKRGTDHGWVDNDREDAILLIKDDPTDEESDRYNMLENYGALTMEEIRRHEEATIFGKSRAAQDNYMLYSCLMESLDVDAKNKILVHKKEYLVTDPDDADGDSKPSGVLLLKLIIRESHVDSNASTTSIRTKLSKLDEYMAKSGSDITKFNQYVLLLLSALSARGERTEDLLVNLFKGYAAASDKRFVAYIGRRKERYDEGEDLTHEALMNLANEKFKSMKDEGTWNSPSEEEERILALEAKLQATIKKQGRGKPNPARTNADRPVAGTKKPKALESKPNDADKHKPIYWKKKPWYWCDESTGGKCNGKWRCHKPSDCRGKDFKPDLQADWKKKKSERQTENQEKEPIKGDTHKGPKRLKLAKAMQAISGDHSDDSDASS